MTDERARLLFRSPMIGELAAWLQTRGWILCVVSLEDKKFWLQAKKRDFVTTRVRGVHLTIGLVDACPLRCPTCPVGTLYAGSGKLMTLTLFREIIAKVFRETRVRSFTPHIWGDPLLHPELPAFIRELKRHGNVPTVLSTTLNKENCDLEDLLNSGLDTFIISHSGWTHYARDHRGGDARVVWKRLLEIRGMKKSARIVVRFHRYNDNAADEKSMRFFVERYLGFAFEPIDATFLGVESLVEGNLTEADQRTIGTLPEDPREAMKRHAGGAYCYMQDKHLTITPEGMAYLCCQLRDERFELVPFLDVSLQEIRRIMRAHKFCASCMNKGAHTYRRLG